MWQNLTIEKSPKHRRNMFEMEVPTYAAYILFSSFIACAALFLLEQYIGVNYLIKTAAKLLLFISIPLFYGYFLKRHDASRYLRLRSGNKNTILIGLISGVIFAAILFGGYYLLKSYIDLKPVYSELEGRLKITPMNFIYAALYITFFNSFIEEFFFRGFIFLNLYEEGYKILSYVFSSLLFAAYHVAIFKNWFSPVIFVISLVGLTVVALFFNLMNRKSKSIFNSWISHMLADCTIMVIGFMMFGII